MRISKKKAGFNHGKKSYKVKILRYLEGDSFGKTTNQLIELVNASQATITKYTLVLEAEGKIECRVIGGIKVFRLKGSNQN